MINVEDLLKEHNIEYMKTGQHHHARDGWLQLDCPYCSPKEKRFRLGYNLHGKYFSCWACGPKNGPGTLATLFKFSYFQAANLLKDVKKERKEEKEIKGVLELPKGMRSLEHAHIQYLKDRKFNYKKIENLWKIQATTNFSMELNWRIIIPIHYQNEIVSWTSRSISKGTRYITASKEQEAMFHKNLLYGEDFCRTNSIIVHEGPFDVWRTGPGSVCTFGTNFSLKQIKKIGKYETRCICFDSTKEGQMAAKKLVELLAPFPGQTFNVILDSKDMGEGTSKERNKLRSRFLWPLDD